MTIAEAYLGGSRFSSGSRTDPTDSLSSATRHGWSRMVSLRQGTWRCLNVVGGLLSWMASSIKVADLDEVRVERYLRDRGHRQTIQAR